jgi:protein O-GlcNAc transferase
MDEATRQAFARALELHREGDPAAAAEAYRTLYSQAAHPKIAHMLAVALHQQQRSNEALAWFERAQARPSAAFHANYAAALLAVGRSAEAEGQARLALAAAPGHAGARLNLALALEAQQRFDAAAAEFGALVSETPVGAIARRGRIRCLLLVGEIEAARAALGEPAESDDAEVSLLRAQIDLEDGRLDTAQAALARAAEAPSTRVQAWMLQARLEQQRSHRGTALGLLDQALADDGGKPAALQAIQLLLECGRVTACLERLQRWIDSHPGDAEMHSLYLRCLQYASSSDAGRLLAAHRQWAQAHALPAEFVAPRPRAENEPLRIGWLSPAFRNGPLQSFFLATLRELGEQRLCENVLYNCSARHEASSHAFRAAGDRWEDVAGLDDGLLVQRIRGDGIDILVDLAGHARGGRLSALARRAAPVQVTWLDSFGTTGVDAMDFVLTDRVASPPGSESGFVERLLHLPRGRLCYLPPLPAELPDPASRRFISLNHFAKLNDQVIAVWAEILRALPDWTLHLKARAGDDAIVIERLHERFAQHGVAARRVGCTGYGTVAEALGAYRCAAIALDPFPFAGGANSCDALWMGLPLVTWPRDTLISRQGASFLHTLGCHSWIARDAGDYVAIACGLAADVAVRRRWSEIAAARTGEHLSDAGAFAVDLIAALRHAWNVRAGEDFRAASR